MNMYSLKEVTGREMKGCRSIAAVQPSRHLEGNQKYESGGAMVGMMGHWPNVEE